MITSEYTLTRIRVSMRHPTPPAAAADGRLRAPSAPPLLLRFRYRRYRRRGAGRAAVRFSSSAIAGGGPRWAGLGAPPPLPVTAAAPPSLQAAGRGAARPARRGAI